MKAVRFSVNQAIGNNKTALPSKRKGKQRGKKMDISEIAKKISMAAGVYESFKDQTQHQKIIDLCNQNSPVKLNVKGALRCILGKNEDFSVEDGLSELLSASPAPCWAELSKDARHYLEAIAQLSPQLVKKTASTIATASTAATIPTTNTGRFRGVSVEEVTPAAFQVVLGAAYKKAKARGLETGDIDTEFGQLFWTHSEHYQTAYGAVVREGRQIERGTMTELPWDLMERAIKIVDLIDVAAQNRADSTNQTDFDHLYQAAMLAFSKFLKEDFTFTQEQIADLLNLVFQPTVPS